MRILGAINTDVRFQIKQGFYLIYILLTLLYMVLLGALPNDYMNYIIPALVFTDPTIVGFFFIGGIIMLEKEQGVLEYIFVTPLRIWEYVLSKVISLSILAVIAGVGITLASNYSSYLNVGLLGIGIFLTSVFFVLIGILASIGCRSLNNYIVRMVPIIILLILPCISIIGFRYSFIFNVIPSVIGLRLIIASFNKYSLAYIVVHMVSLMLLNFFLFKFAVRRFANNILKGGY